MGPSEATIINILAHGRVAYQWKINTLMAFRSAVLDLLDNQQEIRKSFAHEAFFQAVSDLTLREGQDSPVDISPIVEHFE
jgi:hypothetical protein